MFAKRLLNGLIVAGTCGAALAACSAGEAPETEGSLRVYAGLDAQGRPFTRYALDTADGLVPLEIDATLTDISRLRPAQRVAAHGERTADGKLRVDGLDMIEARDGVGVVQEELALGATRTAKLLVLMAHRGTPDSQTADTLKQKLFTSADSARALIKESSFGKLDLSGDVYGWFKVSAATGCDESALAEEAKTLARAQNINPDAYDHVLYYFPLNSACAFSGLGEVGSPASPLRQTWYNGEFSTYLAAHELGHNLGFMHAHALDCGELAIASAASCTPWEYGDSADPMGRVHFDASGGHHAPQFNGFFRAAQSWIGGCNVVTAATSGEFSLTPIETQTSEPQVLRFKAPSSVCPADIPSCYYYVEYRQPIGAFDGDYFKTAPMHEGVLIRLASAIDASGTSTVLGSYLVDTNPSLEDNYMDARLAFGKTFNDSAGVQISAVAAESGKARVKVTLSTGSGSATCLDGTTYGGGGGSCPDYVQPMAGNPGYKVGDKVKFNGAYYESLISSNFWSPSAAPQYWKGTTCGTSCTPSCSGKTCGPDGCNGSCGTCGSNQSCSSAGQCEAVCTRNCSGKTCGDDGCGGSCGTCSAGSTCSNAGTCQGGGTCTAFKQPMAGDPGYKLGDRVTFNAAGYESTISRNYWSPSAAPQYWKSATCN
jgi:hypothetical protein